MDSACLENLLEVLELRSVMLRHFPQAMDPIESCIQCVFKVIVQLLLVKGN